MTGRRFASESWVMKAKIPLEISRDTEGNETVLKLSGDLLATTLRRFEEALKKVRVKGCGGVCIDLEGLRIIDSRGLGSLVKWYRHFTAQDIGFRLMKATGAVLKSLQLTDLNSLFDAAPPAESVAVQIARQRKALWESHEYVEQIMAALGEGVVGLDPSGDVLFANSAAEELLGRKESELFGRPFLSELKFAGDEAKEDRALCCAILEVARGSRKVCRAAVRLGRRDGTELAAELVATSIRPGDSPAGAILGLTDLSDRLEAARSVRAAHNRYLELVKNTSDMVYTADTRGKITYASPILLEVLGLAFKELEGEQQHLIIQDEDLACAQTYLQARLRGEKAPPLRCHLKRRDGRPLPVEIISNPIHGTDDEVQGLQAIVLDVSERERTVEALRDSENRLRSICENSPNAIVFCRMPDGSIVYANPAAERITGYSLAELCQPDAPKFGHPDDKDIGIASLAALAECRAVPTHEVRVVTKQGAVKWVDCAWIPLVDEQGEQFGCLCIMSDITERKQAEMALRHALLRFETVINRTPLVATQSLDRNGVIRYWNTTSEDLYGLTAEEAIGRTVGDLVATEAEETIFRETLEGVWRTCRASGPWERLVRAKNGEERRIYSAVFPIVEGGKTTEVFCMDVDITERKKAEMALAKSEKRYRRMLAAITNYTFTVNVANDDITTHSAGSRAVLGWSPEELHADPTLTRRIIHPEDKALVLSYDARIRVGQTVPPLTYRVFHRDGTLRWIRLTVASHFGSNGELLSYDGLVEDVTETKRIEEDLRQAQKMEALGQLAGGIAHDFNNILTGILGNLSLAEMDAPPEVRPALSEAQKAGQRMADLVKELLAFSRKSQVVMQPTNLSALVEEVADFARNTFDRRIQIVVRQPKDLRAVMGDAVQLHQVILNLCVNARDALSESTSCENTAPPCITIETRNVDFGVNDRRVPADALYGPFVELVVADTGIGMDDETRQRIFAPFFTTKTGGKGTGLGLSLVYGIVNQHRGWIDVSSESGKGSIFKVYLPAALEAAWPQKPEQREDLPRGSETVLLVDDEEMIRSLGKTILTRLGYQVILGIDGRHGLDTFLRNSERIDLTILDMSMPYLSGAEVLGQIRLTAPNAKVILSSGYSDRGLADPQFAHLAPAAFVSKPYSPVDLACIVRQVLDDSTPAR